MSCIVLLLLGLAAAGDEDPAPDLRADPPALQDERRRSDDQVEFSLGPAAGYLRVRDADRGTWFGGVQARVRFLRYLGVEGSITVHQDEFADGDVEVTTYPVQVTALLFPFPDSPVEPYGLFGAGWYYTRFDFDDALGGGDETDRTFGFHAGAGLQVELSPRVHLFGDFRWIFMDEPGVDNGNIEDEEFDTWQVALGLGLRF